MDPFCKLPPEIRVEIIVEIESQTSIINLIRASPVICSQYTTCKGNITRKILTNISGSLHGDLLQDALGILHFPSSGKYLIHDHITQWIAKAFPDPFGQSPYDQVTISKLHCIFSRIIIFIEDYVSKAIDPYPPRAYLALPPIVSSGERLFKGKTVDIKPVSFSSLTASENHRLVGAFLKHEMICKVYNPQVWSTLRDTHCATLLSEEDGKLLPTEIKELYCVHEYIKAAYGAIFAHCQDSWLPDRPAVSPSEVSGPKASPSTKHGILYPDTVYFDPTAYFGTINDTRHDRLPNLLPCFGLDLLTKILVSLKTGDRDGQYLKTWLFSFTKEIGFPAKSYSWDMSEHFFLRDEESVSHDPDIFFRGLHLESCRKRIATLHQYDSLNWLLRDDKDPWVHQQLQHQLQLVIYRQRAWGLFDDTRLYPDMAKHLPTMNDLDEQRRVAGVTPSYERPRRRSKRWQDWYSGRSLESPMEQEEVEWAREVEPVPYNADPLGRFFDKQTHGKVATFWRREGDKESVVN